MIQQQQLASQLQDFRIFSHFNLILTTLHTVTLPLPDFSIIFFHNKITHNLKNTFVLFFAFSIVFTQHLRRIKTQSLQAITNLIIMIHSGSFPFLRVYFCCTKHTHFSLIFNHVCHSLHFFNSRTKNLKFVIA